VSASRRPLRLRIDPPPPGGMITLRGAELRHLRVRRLNPGDTVVCFDDSGTEYRGDIVRMSSDAAQIAVAQAARPERESPLQLTLAQAALKSDHLDLVVEKATEIGVAAINLFECERSVAQPSAARLERLRRIAASAAKQSGRVRVPEIRGLLAFDELLQPPAILFHPGADAPLTAELGSFADLTAIVGPEGGFSAAEIERAVAAGCHIVGLGPRILRGETAGIAVSALCQFLWGDMVVRR